MRRYGGSFPTLQHSAFLSHSQLHLTFKDKRYLLVRMFVSRDHGLRLEFKIGHHDIGEMCGPHCNPWGDFLALRAIESEKCHRASFLTMIHERRWLGQFNSDCAFLNFTTV